jgi:hypothetical protein
VTKHRIAYMADPVDDDRKSAIVVAVHTARDYLSIAERSADGGTIYYPDVLNKIQGADNALGTAATLCREVDLDGTKNARELLARAREATKAAYHQGSIARSYAEKKHPSDFEERQAKKTRQILRRSAEAARQETHRALAELLDVFPDAYTEDEP